MDRLLRFNPEPFGPELELENFEHQFESETEMEEEFRPRGGMRGSARPGRSQTRPSPYRPPARISGSPHQFRTAQGRFAGQTASSLRSPGGGLGRLRKGGGQQGHPWTTTKPGQRHFGLVYHGWRNPWRDVIFAPTGAYDGGMPSEFVSWIQSSLNDRLGLRLPVDGIMSAATRSAVRSFQERQGLPVTGLVGPETEAALRQGPAGGGATGASDPAAASAAEPAQPPADATAAPSDGAAAGELEFDIEAYHPQRRRKRPKSGYSKSAPAPGPAPLPAVTIAANAASIARKQYALWDKGKLSETQSRALPMLQDYWKTGLGISYSSAQLASPAFQKAHYWSAAFISWVMRKAGAGSAFKYAASHSVYFVAARKNRAENNSNPFKAYRPTEIAPRPGDLICNWRDRPVTYDSVKPGDPGHCDVVVEVKSDHLLAIGGNKGTNGTVLMVKVPIDANGRLKGAKFYGIIRAEDTGGSVSPAPSPRPQPSWDPAPSVVPLPHVAVPSVTRSEQVPPATTLYARIDLAITDKFGIKAEPMTGIFVPNGFVSGRTTDIVLWLHGHKGDANRRLTIDQYWKASRVPYGAFREGVNDSDRNLVLVAPTLGARSEAGTLVKPGGLDRYLAQVLSVLGQGVPSGLGNLILACHSGGGSPMRRIAGGSDRALANLRECWGYDCTYNTGDDGFWADWAKRHPGARCFIYYIKGSPTAKLAESLQNKGVPNAIVLPSRDGRHNYVPITHWKERLQGAPFLRTRRSSGPGPSPQPVPQPLPSGEPNDLKSLSHAEFIEFVGTRARKAMSATGVPASVTVAQAIVETGWGKHTIGSAKNLFGIKGKGPAGSVTVPTKEYVNGQWITIEAPFAKYNSFEESIVEHARFFLRNKRYAKALSVKDDAEAFAREIHKAGYATGPDYASQLIKLMRQNNLRRFDS
ncbi:hypothetical protein FHX15_005277 [Rhizobium sp. BK650]|uniref:DUF2272 domain-containing protein n=1 Tax=Rhizobium sp. BK650 TaxID=2586990 RepID=UPI00160B7B0F|nr:DUF2272 domain-containing protein [Rhizobium sp. BK650]MBB3660008.1 hypothetical protein [Rhizobium sp. BK650]